MSMTHPDPPAAPGGPPPLPVRTPRPRSAMERDADAALAAMLAAGPQPPGPSDNWRDHAGHLPAWLRAEIDELPELERDDAARYASLGFLAGVACASRVAGMA